MASTINFGGLTLNTEEARSASEVIFTAVFAKPTLEAAHMVETGVDMDRFIPILGTYGLMGKASSGCTPNTESGTIPTSQKTWTPKLIDFRLEHCQNDVPGLLKFWQKSMKAANTWSEIDGEMAQFIADRALDAASETILRLSSFGDTAAQTYALGGNIKDAATLPYFTVLNGLWKQIFTAVTGNLSKRVTIAANITHTQVMAADVAITTMRSMYNQIDSRFFSKTDKVFECTRSFYDNYVDTLESKSLAFSLAETVDGVSPLKYRGIPIVVRFDWDTNIAAYLKGDVTVGGASPATVTLPYFPHRCILTTLSNIPIGTSDTESFTEFSSNYDVVTKKWYMDVAFKLDVKLLEEHLLVAAY